MKLWILPIKKETRCGAHWAKLRIKKLESGEDYIDVLVGRLNKDPHSHVGYSIQDPNKMIFCESRGMLESIENKVKSHRGHKRNIFHLDKEVESSKGLIVRCNVDQKTWEVKIVEFCFVD